MVASFPLEPPATTADPDGNAARPLQGQDLAPGDFSGPATVLVHHGTTHRFDRFDISVRANPDAAFGRVHYFTSARQDAEINYACEGPDLTIRIETDAERIAFEIERDPTEFGLDPEAGGDEIEALATAIARNRHLGPCPRVLDIALRIERPFFVEGTRNTGRARDRTPLVFPDLDGAWDLAMTTILGRHGIADTDDREIWDAAVEAHEEEIVTQMDALRDDVLLHLEEAFSKAASRCGIEAPAIPETVAVDLDMLTHNDLYRALTNDPDILKLEDPEEGGLVGADFVSGVIEALGYDSILLFDADCEYPRMTMPCGTTHIHVFQSQADRILILDGPDPAPGATCRAA